MKIKSLLIANRGEIAIRIIKTARKMGIRSYVIKTSKEPNAWYLDEADEIIDFSAKYDELIPLIKYEKTNNKKGKEFTLTPAKEIHDPLIRFFLSDFFFKQSEHMG